MTARQGRAHVQGTESRDASDRSAEPAAAGPEGRGLGISIARHLSKPLVLLPGIALLVAWEVASGWLIRETYVSRPTDVAERLLTLFTTGEVYPDLLTTGQELGYGYLIGFLSGIIIGYALGRSRALSQIFEPYILAFYGVPKIALAPLFIIWFGIGMASKVALAAIMVFFLVFFNVYMGVRNVNQDYVDLAKIMGADQRELTRSVYVPAAMPHIIMGLRAALPYGVIGVIVGEFMAAREGIGLYMYRASSTYDPAGVFAGIMILLTFILIANVLLSAIERRVLRWDPKVGKQASASA